MKLRVGYGIAWSRNGAGQMDVFFSSEPHREEMFLKQLF